MTKDSSLNINYTKFYLDNGIKCVLYPRNEIHSVSVQVNIGVGGLDEKENTNGISHFIEHVVHDGTKDLKTWEDVDNYVNEYSGNTNAYTSLDHTQYYGTFPSQFLDQALYYFSQIVLHPTFKEKDIEKERVIIIDEKKRYEDEIEHNIITNIKDNRFKTSKTSYSYDIIGTNPNLESFKAHDLIKHYDEFYVPSNMEIYIVGNLDINSAKKLLEKHFVKTIKDKKFGIKPSRDFKSSYPEYAEFSINTNRKLDVDQYYLTIDFPGFEFTTTPFEERYKLGFVRSMTASSEFNQSILWKRLREELGIVYGISTWSYDMQSRKITALQTSFDKKYLEVVLKEIYEGINKIRNKQIESIVFNAKKKKVIDTQLMQLDKPEQALNWIIAYEDELQEHGRGLMLSEYLEFVEKLNFTDTIECSNKIYDWSKAQIGIVSKDDPNEVKKVVEEMWKKITS